MKIESARYSGGELVLKTASPDAIKFAYKFKPGDYELKKEFEKRSLDANKYCWELCTKIAAKIGITKEEVYQNAIQEGDQCVYVAMPEKDFGIFAKSWQSRGIGWRVQLIDSPGTGTKYAYAYYGSSAYDKAAMSRLIDSLIQECKNLDIETLPPYKILAMLEAWE